MPWSALSRGCETDADSESGSSASRSLDKGPVDVLSSSFCASITSGDSRASEGRYEFMATTEAPKPTLAHIAKTAERIQRGEVEDRKRKRTAAEAPENANASNSGFRLVAGSVVSVVTGTRGPLTAVCNTAHRDDSECLECYGYRVHIEAADVLGDYRRCRE